MNGRLGNDIVDLLAGENLNSLSHGFIQRVFTTEEQEAIRQSAQSNKMIWALWSAKEAAYKAWKKWQTNSIFDHKHFAIDTVTLDKLNTTLQSEVVLVSTKLFHDRISFNVSWSIDNEKIHCITVLYENSLMLNELNLKQHLFRITADNPDSFNRFKKFFSRRELESIYSSESLYTRYYAKQFLYELGFDQQVEIIRTKDSHFNDQFGPPHLMLKNTILPNELSISHDGHWGAIVVSI